MTKDDVTRRAALSGMMGAAAAPYMATASQARDKMGDATSIKRIFIDLKLADAEAATKEGQIFQLVNSVAGTAAVYRRATVGSDKLYDEVTTRGLGEPDGSAKVGYDGGTVATRLNILSATMRPAMRGIFSSDSDQRAALLDFINEAAEGGKTIEWGPIDLSMDVVTKVNGLRGLVVPSGSRWIMHPDTRLRALPNDAGNYEIINIQDADDIVIEGGGGRVVGDRNAHTGADGEWGMGLSIRGSSNVRVRDLLAEDCWGDGFYIGATARQPYCRDIILQRTKAVRSRRNGLSLISARGFLSEDHESIGTNGIAPQAGVDIEPNSSNEFLEDITFQRTTTRDSVGIGFGIYLNALVDSKNAVSIRVVDCVDSGSTVGFSISNARNFAGRIDLIRPKTVNAQQNGISIRRKAANGPIVRIEAPLIIDWNRSNTKVAAAAAGISVFAPLNNPGTEALGGVDILNPDIQLTKNDTEVSAAIFVKDQRHINPKSSTDVRILDPLNLARLGVWLGAERATFQDRNRVSVRMLPDSNFTLGAARFFVHNIIEVSEDRNYTLTRTQAIGVELVFEVARNTGMGRIHLPSGEQLYPDNVGKQGFIGSTEKGARLRIKKTGPGEWMIMDKIGTWMTG